MTQSASATPPKPSTATLAKIVLPQCGYLWMLFALVASATIFEGYDITIFHLCTPNIARTFAMSDAAIGDVATIVRLGGVLSLFMVISADIVGRKPIISTTVIAYTALTMLTALSRGMVSFTIFQSAAQLFLAAEFGVAVTMIGEEFPDAARGRAIAGLHTIAFLGVAAAGILYGYVAGSRWGWRGMYALGVLPLVLTAILRRGLRETARFATLEESRRAHGREREQLSSRLRGLSREFAGPYRDRMILVATLWNSLGLVGGPLVTFFSLYAQREHHWTETQVGHAIVLAYLAGCVGSLMCGWLIDGIGRRATTTVLYLLCAASAATLFLGNGFMMILLSEIGAMFAYQAARTATSALTAELFPTEIRASCFNVSAQVLGQIGWVLAPGIVGHLSLPMGGLGRPAALLAVGPVIGAVVVLLFVPETVGMTLEQLSPPVRAESNVLL